TGRRDGARIRLRGGPRSARGIGLIRRVQMSPRGLAAWFPVVAALAASSVVAPSIASGQTVGVRQVSASTQTLIPLNTKVRYTTMVVLPEDDEILDVICGDRDFWVISAAQNIAHVKPAKEGAATNLNLVTASGMVYSFLLTEGKGAQPDLKLYVKGDA